MASIAAILDQALRAANVPIVGVSIGDTADRTKWTVQFLPGATPAQIVTAQTIVNTVVVDATAQQDADAIGDVDAKALRAAIQALWECIPAPTMTKAQLRTRAIAIWKTL